MSVHVLEPAARVVTPHTNLQCHPSLRSILSDKGARDERAQATGKRASRQSLGSAIIATLKHMATFLHLLLLLTRAAAGSCSGQRLGHVCTECNPPGLAQCQPYSSQDRVAQNWPKLPGSPK